MVAKTLSGRFVILLGMLLVAAPGLSQDELRKTFFKEADAAKAAAEGVQASLLAPRTWERGMKEYEDAEEALERGRNIEWVRDNAADATNSRKPSSHRS